MIEQPKLPDEIVNAFRDGRAAIFVGAGASVAAGLPTWNALVANMAKRLDIKPDCREKFSPSMLSMIPQFYENRFGRRELTRLLETLIQHDSKQHSQVHQLLAQLPCDLFYTTNFDELLESALKEHEILYDLVTSEETARYYSEKRRCQVRKIHGTITQPHTMIITRSDYAHFLSECPIIVEALHSDMSSHIFLFVGYSLNDPDFNSIYDHVFYSMQQMTQRHFVCVLSSTQYEDEYLRARGMTMIDLNIWSGNNPSEKLINFLNSLVESTSEVVHVRRFFRGIQRGQHIPIVITSRIHEIEKYVFYPACDMHAARQVEKALLRIGCTSQIVADKLALEKVEDYLHSNLVLVCSPSGNSLTRHVFELAEKKTDCSISQRFTIKDSIRTLEDCRSGRIFKADALLDEATEKVCTEYALIARYINPWNPGRYIFVFAGINAIGTHVIGDFLADMDNYRKIPLIGENAIAVLEITYRVHDPYSYKYELKSVIDLNQSR